MLNEQEEIRWEKAQNELNYCKYLGIKKIEDNKRHKDINKNHVKHKKEYLFNLVFLNHLKSYVRKEDISIEMIEKEESYWELFYNVNR